MKSMTGYAYLEKIIDESTISCEIKSYNSRFFDLNVNIPSWMNNFEPYVKNYLKNRISRGKIDFSLRIKNTQFDLNINPNKELACAYESAIKEIAKALNREDQVSLSLILNQDGVLTSDRVFDGSKWEAKMTPLLDELFQLYDTTRTFEGKALEKDIVKMIAHIEEAVGKISAIAPQMEELFIQQIKTKYEELLESNYDEQRVLQEVAALLIKYSIREELVRLEAHIKALKNELTINDMPGRKIDFICQEINREINTIGSKNQMIEIAREVIVVKDSLENIREQARNLE